ncbi:hypothetical protein NKH77_34640 [Streptomyces sp. M19]
MLLEAFGSLVIGFLVAYAATRWQPSRLPSKLLVLSTGPGAALLGGLVMRAVTGPGYAALVLVAALGFAVAMVTLLLRPVRGLHRSAPA